MSPSPSTPTFKKVIISCFVILFYLDYNAYLNDLREASQAGFDDLCNKANQLQPHIPPLTMKKNGKFSLNIDESSQKRIPTGKLNGDYVALRTSGDGNCFFRTASILAFGDESKHLEMRVRIVVELACNIEYHLNVPNVEERIRVIEEYLLCTSSSKALDKSLIKEAFKGEVRETCKKQNWASHWHVAALPTVIRRPVKVVFPEGSGRIEEIFNDDIHPRDGRLILEPLVIMWTSTNPSAGGVPDHFVPLVPAGEVCSLGKGKLKFLPKGFTKCLFFIQEKAFVFCFCFNFKCIDLKNI